MDKTKADIDVIKTNYLEMLCNMEVYLSKSVSDAKDYLTNELDRIKALPDEPESIFNMKNGQDYWFISGSGRVTPTTWSDNNGYSIGHLAIGNIYLSEQSCEFAVEKLKVIQEIAKWQFKFDRGFVVDWKDEEQLRYYPYYDHEDNRVLVMSLNSSQFISDIELFSSIDKARQCVESIGEKRIKKYLFKEGLCKNQK